MLPNELIFFSSRNFIFSIAEKRTNQFQRRNNFEPRERSHQLRNENQISLTGEP